MKLRVIVHLPRLKRKSPNKIAGATPVGALSSAFAGHVIGPAWLSSGVRPHRPMSIFERFRQKTKSDSADKGRLLVSAAHTYAVSSFVSFLDEFPSLRKVETKQWDATLTTAAIFVAVSRLDQETMSEQAHDGLLDLVTQEAVRLDPQAINAVEDCRAFVDRTYDGLASDPSYADRQFLFSDSLGGWIVWNLVGYAPTTEDERRMVRTLGAHVVHAFYSWWAP